MTRPRSPQYQAAESYVDLVPLSNRYELPPSPATSGTEILSLPIGSLLKRYWLLLLCLILLGSAGGVASVVLDDPVYQARVLLEVQGINEALLKNSLDASGTYESNDMNIQTQIQLLRGGPFLRRVFERLQSETVPLAPMGTDIFSRLRQRVRPSSQDPMQHVKAGLGVALATFEARPLLRTRLIELACDSTSPDIASQFLNTMAAEFMEETMRSRMQASQKTTEWLTAQIEETKTKLHETEERLQQFVQSSGNLFVSQDATLDDAKLAQLRADLSRIQAERIAKQTRYELTVKTAPEMLSEVLDDANLRSQQGRMNELQREKAALETTFTSEHAKVKKLDAQLNVLRANFQTEMNGVIGRIRNEYEAALRQEKSLASAYAEQSQRVGATASKAAQFNSLKREVDTLRQLYQSLLVQSNQAGLAHSVPVSPIRIVEPSAPARTPYKPRPILNISFGVLLGFVVTAAIVFVREKSDQSLKGPGLSRTLLNAPELGVIPSAQATQSPRGLLEYFRRKENYSLTHVNRQQTDISYWNGKPSALAESFRETLASLLRDVGEGGSAQVILVTSSGPGEGKTVVAANLAIALAETGRSTALIDADFRRPRLHHVFQVSNDRSLLDMLAAEQPVAEYSLETLGVSTAIPGLTLVPNRPAQANISRLLHSPRLPELLNRARTQFDMIIIDAPPLLGLADARIIGRMTDGVILVLRAGITSRSQAIEAHQRICTDGLTLFGTVLNDWNPGKAHASRYYYTYSDTDTGA